ncbi:MAG: phosphoribosyltransferase family protein [Patescibacteria group bacterium]
MKCIDCGISGSNFCNTCIGQAPISDREVSSWIYPTFDYRHPPVKKALWLIKYKSKKSLVKIFAEIMYDRMIAELADLSQLENFNNSILIPIPLSKKGHRERGYNQAELLCEELIEIDKNTNFKLGKNILVKTKDTGHQAHIKNKGERMKNIIGAFSIKDLDKNINLIKNKNIILIDDITTTGATLGEAKKVLKNAGARKIIAFTIAH